MDGEKKISLNKGLYVGGQLLYIYVCVCVCLYDV
jgi:hypothetical protein